MLKKIAEVAICIAAFAASAAAQTVTGSGTTNTVPVFTGTSTVGNSPISVSGSNVGIGTTAPAGQLANNSVNYGDNGDGLSGGSLNWLHTNVDPGWNFISSAGNNGLLVTTSQTNGIAFQVSSGTFDPTTLMWTNHLFTLLGTGNVGIGTTSPSAALEVNGSGIKLTANSGASMTFQDGTVQATAWNGVLSGGDYAESVNVSGGRDEYEPGDVLVIDPASEGNFLKSSAPYSTAVTGIYSTRPGVVGRRQRTAGAHMNEEVPMAMTGIVPTKVSAENGPIKPKCSGQLLAKPSAISTPASVSLKRWSHCSKTTSFAVFSDWHPSVQGVPNHEAISSSLSHWHGRPRYPRGYGQRAAARPGFLRSHLDNDNAAFPRREAIHVHATNCIHA
jgi:hypothetical protein